MDIVIRCEKQIEECKRDWKTDLIEKMNPNCTDLHDETDVLPSLEEEARPQLLLG